MSDLDRLFNRPDPATSGFVAWVKSLDDDEIAGYEAELEAFAGDETAIGTFAERILPFVRRVQAQRVVRALLRDAIDEAFVGSVDGDSFADALFSIAKARRQLGEDADDMDVVEVFDAALDVARRSAAVPNPESEENHR